MEPFLMKTSRTSTDNSLQYPNNNHSQFMRKAIMLAAAVFLLLMMSAIASAQVSVTATAGTVGPTPYTTLKLAFDAINAGTHQGAVTIDITASTTEGATPATLNSSGAGAAVYTSVLIRPTADGVSISGNPVTGFGVIQLNGADNVTIDGDNPNTGGTNRNLTVSNTTTATVIANSAIRIATSAAVTSADNDTIKNCVLLGNVTAGNAAAITSTSGSSNSSFGIYVGGNGGATAVAAPTAITSVTANTAPTGTTINNLLIDNNTVNQCARAIVFNGAVATVSTGVTISNNVIGDQGATTPAVVPPYTAPATTVYTKGIWVAGTAAVTVSGNTLRNIMSYVGTTITSIEMVSPVTNPTISNNTATNIANNGTVSIVKAILISSATGTYSIAGNSVTNVQSLASSSGTDGIEVTAGSTGGTIERNKIQTVYSRSAGTFGAYGLNLTSGTGIVIRNNFVSDINMDMTGGAAFSTQFSVHGIRIAGGTNHKVYHNSVQLFGSLLGTGTTSIMTSAFEITLTTITGVDVRNNIFSNTLTGGTTSIAHVSIFLPTNSATAMSLTLNNNDYFSGADAARQGIAQAGATAGTGFYLASNFNAALTTPATNLRALTTVLGPGTNDNATQVVDPQYVSSTDLHIAVASPMVDTGDPAVGVTTDIDGQLRVGNPDIGADEPSGTTPPANDIAATAFVSPVSGGTVATSVAFAPQASFTGAGTATQTNVPVRYRVLNAGLSEVCNVVTTVPSLANSQTATATFPTCTLTPAGVYTIKAKAENPGDANAANDEITGTLNVVDPFNGSYNVGTAQAFTSLTNPGGIFEALNAAGATGNVVVNITSDLSGETGSVALNQLAGAFTVTIKPSGAARSITSTVTAIAVIKLNDADNVTIDGSLTGGTDRSLTISNINTAGSTAAIWLGSNVNGAQSNTVKNMNLSAGADQSTGTAFTFGIISSTSASILTGGTDNDNNSYTNNSIQKVSIGIISIGGLSTNPNQNTTISKNQIGPSSFGANEIGTCGVLLFNENAPAVTGNEVRFVGDLGTTGGGSSRDRVGIEIGSTSANWSGTAAGATVMVTNANISGNTIHDIVDRGTFSAVGIVENATNSGAATSNTIANNMIYNVLANGTSPDQTVGIGISNGNGDKIVYNSVFLTGDIDPGAAASATISSFGISINLTGVLNPTLRDNAVVMDLSSNTVALLNAAVNIPTAFSWGTGGANFDDWFPTAANAQSRLGCVGGSGGTFHATLAAWQVATVQDAASISANPNFISATDLHIGPTSPVLSVGDGTGTGITADFDNDPRPVANPDIGADELVQAVGGVIPGGTF
jgi:hypothetical protein